MRPLHPQPDAPPTSSGATLADPADGLRLIDIYLRLIADQERRLSAYEQAIQAERNQLADMPDEIADLEEQIAQETQAELLETLTAKLEEARSEFGIVLRRVAARETTWPEQKADFLNEIARLQDTIRQNDDAAA